MYKSYNFGIGNILKNHVFSYPSPVSINYFWNFGFVSGFFLVVQIITGIFLAMHYCADTSLAFFSVEHIMRDVSYGWLLRYWHANGASFFFVAIYLHIGRNLYFQKWSYPNRFLWWSGLVIFFLTMATAFVGYILPWGQMSFWGATVITNLFSAIPVIGTDIVIWLWGGYAVSNPTLSRFYSIHYILPIIIVLVVLLHLYALHEKGSTTPSLLVNDVNVQYTALYPYFLVKDLIGLLIFLLIYTYCVVFYPNYLGHSDNFIEADAMVTPLHIVPEWYFLPFYAVLRSIADKLTGVIVMGLSIAVYFIFPYAHKLERFLKININEPLFLTNLVFPFLYMLFFAVFVLLGWVGAKPVNYFFVSYSYSLVELYFFLLIFNVFYIKPISYVMFGYCSAKIRITVWNFSLVYILRSVFC